MKKAFSLVEVIIAFAIATSLIVMVAMSFKWFSHAMGLIETLEHEAMLLRIPRLADRQMQGAREILYPQNKGNQLILRLSNGDVMVYFLDKHGRFTQYSHEKEQFRDLLYNVMAFDITRENETMLNYSLKIKQKEKELVINGRIELDTI